MRKIRPALRDILDTIERIEAAVAGKTLEDFQSDCLLRFAVQRAIEIISEASRRIPEELQSRQPQIPWRNIATIGNILRHEYQSISDRIIWSVVHEHLPSLKQAVQAMDQELHDP